MIQRPLSKCVTTFWPLGGVSYPYVVNEREALLYVCSPRSEVSSFDGGSST